MPLKSCFSPILYKTGRKNVALISQVKNLVAYYFLYFEPYGTIHKKEKFFDTIFSIPSVFSILYLYFPSKKYNKVTQTRNPYTEALVHFSYIQ